ncbi:MAG: hypothetical protein EHM20_06190, partial [Alphaproteobacteria bacterium]
MFLQLYNMKQQAMIFCLSKSIIIRAFFFLIFVFSSGIICFGQNSFHSVPKSTIAFAYPIDLIKVDGDISDWSKDTIRYPIQKYYRNKTISKDDSRAYFQVAYNKSNHALYFLVVVSDDSYIIDTNKGAHRNSQDSYSLYIDTKHSSAGSGIVSYQFNEKWKNLINPSNSWDPDVKKATWDNVETASKRQGIKTIYEYKIDLGQQVYAGKTIGVDHIIIDKDIDDKLSQYTLVTWNENQNKANLPGRLGCVILMSKNEPTSVINGRMKWENDSIKGFPGNIRITSTTNPSLWAKSPIDSIGRYSAELPVGTYKISPFYNTKGLGDNFIRIDSKKSTVLVDLKGNSQFEAPILVFSTLSLPDVMPAEGILHSFNKEKANQLDEFIKSYRDYYEIPGISLALIKDGQVVYHKTYGVKNSYTQESVNDSTLFRAASLTKPVFAFAVCRLAEKGIIDLDRPLYQYLPFEEIAYDERSKLITARYVLCHQTGFPNWAYENKDGKLDIKFTPGTSFGYSGQGFEYLQRVVVQITQKDILTVMKEEVIEPLELNNTYFAKSEYLSKVSAYGHTDNLPGRLIIPESPNMAWTMYTEAKSFTTFMLALLNRRGIKPETYDDMFRFHTIVPLDGYEQKIG